MLLEIVNTHFVVNSLVFSCIGIVMLFVSFWIFEKITPEKVWHEIVKNRNTAVAVLAASFILALGIIIASAIH